VIFAAGTGAWFSSVVCTLVFLACAAAAAVELGSAGQEGEPSQPAVGSLAAHRCLVGLVALCLLLAVAAWQTSRSLDGFGDVPWAVPGYMVGGVVVALWLSDPERPSTPRIDRLLRLNRPPDRRPPSTAT
jgi:hypothetical protein